METNVVLLEKSIKFASVFKKRIEYVELAVCEISQSLEQKVLE